MSWVSSIGKSFKRAWKTPIGKAAMIVVGGATSAVSSLSHGAAAITPPASRPVTPTTARTVSHRDRGGSSSKAVSSEPSSPTKSATPPLTN
jgi:hypothetical protein